MRKEIGFNKMVTSKQDKTTRYYSPDKVVLIRTNDKGEKVVSSHTDNCNNLYHAENGSRKGIAFIVLQAITTSHDSKGNKLDKKQDKVTYQANKPYYSPLGRVPFARQFGYVDNIGHSKKFLRDKGFRAIDGSIIGS